MGAWVQVCGVDDYRTDVTLATYIQYLMEFLLLMQVSSLDYIQ